LTAVAPIVTFLEDCGVVATTLAAAGPAATFLADCDTAATAATVAGATVASPPGSLNVAIIDAAFSEFDQLRDGLRDVVAAVSRSPSTHRLWVGADRMVKLESTASEPPLFVGVIAAAIAISLACPRVPVAPVIRAVTDAPVFVFVLSAAEDVNRPSSDRHCHTSKFSTTLTLEVNETGKLAWLTFEAQAQTPPIVVPVTLLDTACTKFGADVIVSVDDCAWK
jgi:hypothetical protein